MKMDTTRIPLIALVLILLGASSAANAERYVVVNNQRLNNEQILSLEQLHCGPIANGHYWLNVNTGIWGYAANPNPQGHIKDNCYQPQGRPGLSERGLLFSPSDWVR
jgi:hypothetical protein